MPLRSQRAEVECEPLQTSSPLISFDTFEHRSGAHQIRIVEAFGESLVDRPQRRVCLVGPALRLTQPRQKRGRAQRVQQRALMLGDLDRLTVRSLGCGRVTVEFCQAARAT